MSQIYNNSTEELKAALSHLDNLEPTEMARALLLYRNASNFVPFLEDNFEWVEDSRGSYVCDGTWENNTYACADNLGDILRTFQESGDGRKFESEEEAIEALGLMRFSVDRPAPVDDWDMEWEEKQIKDYIDALRKDIKKKIEEED